MDETFKPSAVNVRQVFFSRGNRRVLNNISADFEQGYFYGILGPNGAGKSTFIEIMAGLLSPESGNASVFGVPVSRLSPRRLARKVAVVSQNADVRFAFSVRDVVMMGRHPCIDRFGSPAAADYTIADTVMAAADISHLSERPVTEISGGERQRTLFARALAQDTPVLFLDEATSSLDMKHTLNLLSFVNERVKKENLCAVGVFQDINTAALFCDRFVFIKEGRVAATGTMEETITPENLFDVFGVKTRVMTDDASRCRQVLFAAERAYG